MQRNTHGIDEATSKAPPAIRNEGPYEPSLSAARPDKGIVNKVNLIRGLKEIKAVVYGNVNELAVPPDNGGPSIDVTDPARSMKPNADAALDLSTHVRA